MMSRTCRVLRPRRSSFHGEYVAGFQPVKSLGQLRASHRGSADTIVGKGPNCAGGLECGELQIEVLSRGGNSRVPEGRQQAFELYATTPLPDLSAVRAPVFLYWGNTDELVPLSHLDRWKAALETGTSARLRGCTLVERVYPGGRT
jgi:hypothetical protein